MDASTAPLQSVTLPRPLSFIGGEWGDDSDVERIPGRDPATESLLGDIPRSTSGTVNQAVQAAQAVVSNPSWRDIPALERERQFPSGAGHLPTYDNSDGVVESILAVSRAADRRGIRGSGRAGAGDKP